MSISVVRIVPRAALPLLAEVRGGGTPRLICAAPENCRREGIGVRRGQEATAP